MDLNDQSYCICNQIKAALSAIQSVDDLPMFQMPDGEERRVVDILEWLSLRFGFQVQWNAHLSFQLAFFTFDCELAR